MKIGELAKKTGCRVVTIRYYEQEGLLAQAERSGGNYRVYGKEAMERLEFILHCRKHDMSLGDIKKLLTFRDRPQHDCTWIGALIDSHIDKVNARIASLELLKHHLEQLRQRCACGNGDGEHCGIMQGLNDRQLCCASCERRSSGETPPGSVAG